MIDPTYRIPTTGLFLEPDGRLVPTPRPYATVVEASEMLAPRLSAAYVGKGLQLMSQSGSQLPDGDQTAESLKKLGQAAETIVVIGDFVELGLALAEFMGLFGHKTDPVMVRLEQIDAHLNRIEDHALAAWRSSRRDQLQLLRSHSATALRFAQEYLELNRPQDPIWASKAALADRDSLFAAIAFTSGGLDSAFWQRPFSLQALGVSPTAIYPSWLYYHPNRAQLATDTGEPVWDYRFTLPAATYAIVARLAVLKAVAPQSLRRGEAGCREIQGYARFLRDVVHRIRDGLWALTELASDQGSRIQFQWHGKAPVAAAQTHSGASFMRIIYAYEWEYLRPADPVLWPDGLVEPFLSFEQVNANIRNVGQHWWHLIWRNIGMLEMCKILSDLDRACTQPMVSRWIGEAHKKLIMASGNLKNRLAASLASSLVQLTSDGDAALDSVRTFRLYESLQLGNPAVQAVLERATDELLAFTPNPVAPPLPPEPVSWWRGEEDARDSVGGHDGRLAGEVRFVLGQAGQAFAFSQGWHVEIPNTPALEPETLTVALWARREAPPTACAYLLSKGANACTAASYALYTGETGGLFFYVSDGLTYFRSPDAGRALWDGGWHFVAGSFDGQAVRLFVDGEQVGEPSPTPAGALAYRLPDGDALYLAAYRGSCELRFDEGQLDEVRLFNRALTADELQALYHDGR